MPTELEVEDDNFSTACEEDCIDTKIGVEVGVGEGVGIGVGVGVTLAADKCELFGGGGSDELGLAYVGAG